MMRRVLGRGGGMGLLGLVLTACAGLQAYDLDQAVQHLSQTDMAARWGAPERVMALPTGRTLWMYTFRSDVLVRLGSMTVVSPGVVVDEGGACTRYLFLFDQAQRLRAWRTRAC